ncbi:MAG: T9SS type A sorting domain-containing protein [Bacteroidales bacterium]|nr:T9SS type A sorting domain-containing protein [Bacteroidales bacterium]
MKKLLLILIAVGITFIINAQSVSTDSYVVSTLTDTKVELKGTYVSLGTYEQFYSGWFEISTSSNFSSYSSVTATPANTTNLNEPAECLATGLIPSTTYYFRFAANVRKSTSTFPFYSQTTVKGSSLSFTTLAGAPPSIVNKSSNYSEYNSTNYLAGEGDVTAEGTGVTVTERGFVYNLIGNPTKSDNVQVYDNNPGTGNFIDAIINLNPGITYYLNVYADNVYGTGYGVPQEFITHTLNPTSISATSITETSFSANWDAVTGAQGYLLDVATDDAFSSFVSGYQNLDVGLVTTYSVNTNLSSGTDYYYRVKAYHDGGADGPDFTSESDNYMPVYTLHDNPNIQAHTLYWWGATSSGQMTLHWTNGNGTARMLIMKAGSAVSNPVDGNTYTANANFGSGDQIGSSGTYVVFNGSGSKGDEQVTITGLSDAVDYYFKVVEYNGTGSTTNYNTSETSGYGVGNIGDGVLPVTLISFAAEKVNENVLLSWATATEENNHFFVIERSENAKDFLSIGEVFGAGNSNIQLYYEFLDDSHPAGVLYYRLKQFDFDGKMKTLKTISIDMRNSGDILKNLYVDNSNLNVLINAVGATPTTVTIMDLNSKLIFEKALENSGDQHLNINMTQQSRGVYFIKVQSENQIVCKKFIY